MGLIIDTVIALAQIVLGFYGFWFVWRTLLPVLPGPPDAEERVARFAGYFTDPLVLPVARWLGLPERMVVVVWLVLVALGQVELGRLAALT